MFESRGLRQRLKPSPRPEINNGRGSSKPTTNRANSLNDKAAVARHNAMSVIFQSSLLLSTCLFGPISSTIISRYVFYELMGRYFAHIPMALAQCCVSWCVWRVLDCTDCLARMPLMIGGTLKPDGQSPASRIRFCIGLISFSAFFNFVALYLCNVFRAKYFRELDGMRPAEFSEWEHSIWMIVQVSRPLLLLHIIGVVSGVALFSPWNFSRKKWHFHNFFLSPTIHNRCKSLVGLSFYLSLGIFLLGGWSAYFHIARRSPPARSNLDPSCDPLDTTECLFPFPSNFFTVPDAHSVTGRKVYIPPDALRSMYKNGGPKDYFLNGKDGFSTSGSVLFYLDGMQKVGGAQKSSRLVGPNDMELSVTSQSITLLIDVNAQTLVHHFAELNVLDSRFPLVELQSANFLKHNTPYAVAVIGAVGSNGKLLRPTGGMKQLFSGKGLDTQSQLRLERFQTVLIPALKNAAPWYKDIAVSDLQLLFEFHTTSEESQLGTVRRLIDSTLTQVESESWGGWGYHNVRVTKQVDGKCDMTIKNDNEDVRFARRIHLEINVPWFLKMETPRRRRAFLDEDALRRGIARNIERAKVMIVVPCSLAEAGSSTALTAVVDYGHGLLASSKEVFFSKSLMRMADENGHIIVASNLRGLEKYDIPLILWALFSGLTEFESFFLNMMQGFAQRAAIQHFYRHGLLEMDFLKLGPNQTPLRRGKDRPSFVYYGISLGGILGAGYTSFLRHTNLIDRAAFTSSGAPFSLVIGRSSLFKLFHVLLSLNLYTDRHFRMLVAFFQMSLDSIDPSGVLSSSRSASLVGDDGSQGRTPILLQNAHGDNVVAPIGGHILARNLNAVTLTTNPLRPFGIPAIELSESSVQMPINDATCVLTEGLYQREEKMTRHDPSSTVERNDVHWCFRMDPAMVRQMAHFLTNGTIIDPCAKDGCIRDGATCPNLFTVIRKVNKQWID